MSIFDLKDEDLGWTAFMLKQQAEGGVEVGLFEDSDKDQFRLGAEQEFKPETAGTLIRKPVDRKKSELGQKLAAAGIKFLFGKTDGTKDLQAVGNTLADEMKKQTDSSDWGGGSKAKRPQLNKAIKVKVDD